MFTPIIAPRFLKQQGNETIWNLGEERFPGFLVATALGYEIVRVRFLRGNSVSAARYVLVDEQTGTLPYHSWMVTTGDEHWSKQDESINRQVSLAPYLQGFAFSPTQLQWTCMLAPNEYIYGLGERTGTMNKRGQAFPIWNVDPPTQHIGDLETMYTSIPFFIGLQPEDGHTYGVLIDHTGKVEADLGNAVENLATLTVEGDELVAYFFAGPTPADVLRQYGELTGRMPLPARWAIGHHQSRWGYTTTQEVAQVAHTMRERHHPCDSIWLDIDYMDRYRNFTWDPQRFAEPAAMADDLHTQHLHLVTILDPGTSISDDYDVYTEGKANGYFSRYPSGDIFVGSVWPGDSAFPDFSRAEVRAWWGDLYQRLLDKGVDGIWNDMNEPALTNSLLSPKQEDDPDLWGKTMDPAVLHRAGGDEPNGPDGPALTHQFFHNAFGMEMTRSTYEGLLTLRPNTRPFVLTRSGTAGMQRYTALWTGDNSSLWEHIDLAIRMSLNVSMSGMPFVGADIGGFWGPSNGELLTRFVQMGALLPFSRNHNSKENPGQEPWAFGEPYESAYRKAIETRYQLLPSIYTLFHEASTHGSPIIRPLYYHYPQDEEAHTASAEFLLGPSILSAPITVEGATSREVYLPDGLWFDYWDGTEYPGSGVSEVAAPLDRWPLFVKSDSIIATGPVVQYADEQPESEITFTCYMGTDGLASYTLYEDDGNTQEYRGGAFATTTVSCRVLEDEAIVRIEEHHTAYKPARKAYEVVVYSGNRVRRQRVPAGQSTIEIRMS